MHATVALHVIYVLVS